MAAWPFDGLAIADGAYENAHVMIEPYPTAVRSSEVPQTDDSDALASAAHLREAYAHGGLSGLFDLSDLDEADGAIVRFEGWIVAHRPNSRHLGKSPGR